MDPDFYTYNQFAIGWNSLGMIILLITAILSPYFMYQSMKKAAQALNNNQIFETVVFIGDTIHMTEGSFSLSIDY